ncbi:thioredoxin family protein [Elusimicrobiota bacterium]
MAFIQIFGIGCAKCDKLYKNAETAAKELGIECYMEKVKDMKAIAARGVFITPALSIDGIIKTTGKVPTTEEIKAMLKE